MKNLYAKIRKFMIKYRKWVVITLMSSMMITSWIITPYITASSTKGVETTYDIKQGDYLFSLKNEDLKKVSDIIVVGSQSGGTKSIVVKYKTDKKIVIYKGLSNDAFQNYSTLVLTPYLEKNPEINFRYMNDFVGLSERIGVANDPTELIANNRASTLAETIIAIVTQILILGALIYMLIYFQSNMIANKVSKVSPKDIKDSLDDLIGLDDIKAELLQLEDMVLNKDLYQRFNIHKNFNVMMTGMAGVGKTKIARCLAKRLDVPMFYASAASLESGYVGGGSRTLKKMVSSAARHGRAIIFLDEAESILQSRTKGAQNWERDTINTLLSLLDGVNTKNNEIIWMVASNVDEHKINMDEAMLRRFQLKINFRLPNFEERKAILLNLLNKMEKTTYIENLDLTHIAGLTSGLSPALLENLIGRASLIAIQEDTKLTQEILLRAYERVAVGLTDRETTANMLEKRRLIATHEAGHFILKLHHALIQVSGDLAKLKDTLNVIKISTESVSKIGALGFVLSKQEEFLLESRGDYEHKVMQLYGGMANEEIYYNSVGVTAGAQDDIEKATQLLKLMIGNIGFYQKHKLNYSVISTDSKLSENQYKLIEEKSEKLFSEAKTILLHHRALTNLLVDKLLEEYVLTIDEALVLIGQYFNTHSALLHPYRERHYHTLFSE